jgi:hypothetical protein
MRSRASPPFTGRRDGWLVAICFAALSGAIVAFVKLDPRAGAAREAVPRPNAVAQDAAPPLARGEAVHAAASEKAAPAAEDGEETDEQAWKIIAATLGRAGTLKDNVYTVVVPRADLAVTLHGNDVPAAAGLETRLGFYRCACGRINVVGQFVVADYETNDVLDALRRVTTDGTELDVASVAPLMLYEKPRLMAVRFQGEALKAVDLAGPIRAALDRTGKAREGKQPLGTE